MVNRSENFPLCRVTMLSAHVTLIWKLRYHLYRGELIPRRRSTISEHRLMRSYPVRDMSKTPTLIFCNLIGKKPTPTVPHLLKISLSIRARFKPIGMKPTPTVPHIFRISRQSRHQHHSLQMIQGLLLLRTLQQWQRQAIMTTLRISLIYPSMHSLRTLQQWQRQAIMTTLRISLIYPSMHSLRTLRQLQHQAVIMT